MYTHKRVTSDWMTFHVTWKDTHSVLFGVGWWCLNLFLCMWSSPGSTHTEVTPSSPSSISVTRQKLTQVELKLSVATIVWVPRQIVGTLTCPSHLQCQIYRVYLLVTAEDSVLPSLDAMWGHSCAWRPAAHSTLLQTMFTS